MTNGNQINTNKLVEIFKKESGCKADNHKGELQKIKSKLALLSKKQSRLLDLLNEGELGTYTRGMACSKYADSR